MKQSRAVVIYCMDNAKYYVVLNCNNFMEILQKEGPGHSMYCSHLENLIINMYFSCGAKILKKRDACMYQCIMYMMYCSCSKSTAQSNETYLKEIFYLWSVHVCLV